MGTWKWLEGGLTPEHQAVLFEYLCMKLCDKYHCLPSQLDHEDWERIKLYMALSEMDDELQKARK